MYLCAKYQLYQFDDHSVRENNFLALRMRETVCAKSVIAPVVEATPGQHCDSDEGKIT